ncbi:MAG: DUF1801 domain-containing protein [Bacteroidota bacterium]
MNFKESEEALSVINAYPPEVAEKLLGLRGLILEVANEVPGLASLEEALKWGEPAYLTKNGSTLRIDWKAKNPAQYAIYFKCTSKLVPTFKAMYSDLFRYEKNRAIVFSLKEPIPRTELKNCIRLALTYHKVKSLPLLGASV